MASAAPEWISREPAAAEAVSRLMPTVTTVDFATHGKLAELPYPSGVTTMKAEFDAKKAEAIDVFNKVVEACRANGNKPFFDKEFNPGCREHLYPDGSPDDCTVSEPMGICRAGKDYLPGAPLFEVNSDNSNVDANDMRQGGTGNCFLIAAVAGIATYSRRFRELKAANPKLVDNFSDAPDPIQRIFVAHDLELGIFALMFSVQGMWTWVLTDSYLAAQDDEGTPLFCTCGPDEHELWPLILEKAYAKLTKSWDAIDGGLSAHAVAVMTGGVKLTFDVDHMTWPDFRNFGVCPCNVMACSVRHEIKDDGAVVGQCGEKGGPQGLVKGHAYTVLDVKQTSDKKGFVQSQNPWLAAEWEGDWSDKSPLWEKFPKYKQELHYEKTDDGKFWISAGDFKKHMTLEATSFFPDTCKVLTMSSVFGSGAEADDIYVIKTDHVMHLRFIIGQHDRSFVEAMYGRSGENHRISKGRGECPLVSDHIGLSVVHHTKGAPNKNTYEASPNKEEISAVITGGETCFTDVTKCPAGYISLKPIINNGIPYYIRVVAPPKAHITVYKLSCGVTEEGAVGDHNVQVQEEEQNFDASSRVDPKPRPRPTPGAKPSSQDHPADPNFVEQRIVDDGPQIAIAADANIVVEQRIVDDGPQFAVAVESPEFFCDFDDGFCEYDYEADMDDCVDGDDPWSTDNYAEGNDEGWLREIFDGFDFDHSGHLDKTEIMAAMVQYFPYDSPAQMLERVMRSDFDGDGKISFAEFCNIVKDATGHHHYYDDNHYHHDDEYHGESGEDYL